MNYHIDKKELEALLLSIILQSESAFLEIAACNPDSGIFDTIEHKIIFSDAMNYFRENNKSPGIMDVYNLQALAADNRESVKECIKKLLKITGADRMLIKQYLYKIIDLKAEKEFRQYKSSESGIDYLLDVSKKALNIFEKYTAGIKKNRSNMEIAESLMKRINSDESGNSYVKTGFENLDKHIIGIPKNHLTIIAGRPGTGKTTFMLQLLRNFLNQGIKAGIFSLEMTAESLLLKNISAETQIDSIRIESGKLRNEEKQKLISIAAKYSEDNYVIIDTPSQTPALIEAQINTWKIQNAVDIILIDYLTLINTNYKETRNDLEIGRLSKELNSIAKSTGIPIILLSQLNRQSEARADKKPILADLRESGSIEQDANMVLLLYRPFQYGLDGRSKNIRYSTLNGEELSREEYFELIIAKARNGRTGSVAFRYRPEIHTIEPAIGEVIKGERIPEGYEHLLKAV